MRPISNVVDVTNYVMLALGYPLHAFDVDASPRDGSSSGARDQGEKMRTLDGHERELTPDDLVIADATHPVAIAGIMGGEESEVRPETTDLLLEAANFDPLTVLRTSRRLRLRTESSTRWEKGVDPYAAEQAAVYATQLLVELAGARWTGHTDVNDGLPERPRGHARARARRPAERPADPGRGAGRAPAVDRLRRRRRARRDRADVACARRHAPVDLVEEVARFRIEDVPATLPSRLAKPAQLTRDQRLRRQVEDVLVGAGFYEAYTWTLVPAGEGRIPLQEPFTAELACSATTSSTGWSSRRVGTATPASSGSRSSSWRGSSCRATASSRTSAGTWPGSPTAATSAQGRRRDASPRAARRARLLAAGRCAGSTKGWGYFEVDLDALFERVPEVVLYEDVITYPTSSRTSRSSSTRA